jgi:toxin ParE1/3/4
MRAAFTVEITEAAESDLQEIVEDVWERTGARTADRLLDDLLECVSKLESFPERGSFPSELAQLGIKDFRQLIFQSYRLIYRVIGRTVFVMVIADGRRDMQRVLERRLLEH